MPKNHKLIPVYVFTGRGLSPMRNRILGVMVFVLMWGPLLTAHAGYADQAGAVVSPQWLKEHLGDKKIKIIEMSDPSSFEFEGHIPGAVPTGKTFWRYQAKDGALVHHAPEKLEKMIKGLGINDGDTVVIYYKGQNLNEILGSYYLYWLFHYLGYSNVTMLDGGWSGWLKAGNPVEETFTEPDRGTFKARPLPALEISTDELYAIRENYTVIDGRPRANFEGRDKFPANTRFGRIPGTLNQPWMDYIQYDKEGRIFLDMKQVPAILQGGMIVPGQPLLMTCFGGTGAAINYVYFYNLGYRNMRLDDAAIRRWNARMLPLIRD